MASFGKNVDLPQRQEHTKIAHSTMMAQVVPGGSSVIGNVDASMLKPNGSLR